MKQNVVAVEGLDGSGKTSLVALLSAAFRARGLQVFMGDWFREKDVQRLAMLFNTQDRMTPETLAAMHGVSTLFQIKEANASNCHIVLWDRYIYSSFASCLNRGASRELMRAIVRLMPSPDLTIFLVESPEVCYQRILSRKGLRFFESNIDRFYRGRIGEALTAFEQGKISQTLLKEVFVNAGEEWYAAMAEVLMDVKTQRIERFDLERAEGVVKSVVNLFGKSELP